MRRFVLLIAFASIAVAVATAVFYFQPDDPRQLYASARRHFRLGEFAAAENDARQAVEADESFVAAALLAAESARELGNARRALSYIESRRDPDAQLLAARILRIDLVDLGAAEAAYRAALSQRPDDRDANDELARLLILCGRRTEARRARRADRFADYPVPGRRFDRRPRHPRIGPRKHPR